MEGSVPERGLTLSTSQDRDENKALVRYEKFGIEVR